MGEPNLSGRVEIDPKHLEHPTLGFLRAYWEGKRGGRPMPSRADINPSEMKQHLSWLVMLDVLEGGRDFRYRLIGDDVADYFFWNPTGKTVNRVSQDIFLAGASLPGLLVSAVLSMSGSLAAIRRCPGKRIVRRAARHRKDRDR